MPGGVVVLEAEAKAVERDVAGLASRGLRPRLEQHAVRLRALVRSRHRRGEIGAGRRRHGQLAEKAQLNRIAADRRRRGPGVRVAREKRSPREDPGALGLREQHLAPRRGGRRNPVDARHLAVDPGAPAGQEVGQRSAAGQGVLDEELRLEARGRLGRGRPRRVHLGSTNEVFAEEDPIEAEPLAREVPEHALRAIVSEHALGLSTNLRFGGKRVVGRGLHEDLVGTALPEEEGEAARHGVGFNGDHGADLRVRRQRLRAVDELRRLEHRAERELHGALEIDRRLPGLELEQVARALGRGHRSSKDETAHVRDELHGA